MTISEMITTIRGAGYNFLCDRPELGDNIIMLGIGGSHAYGTNVDGSDLDIRGIATNTPDRILTGSLFEQSVDTQTDTTIYSFDKILNLLCNCNPNIIEMLGLRPDHYLYLNSVGKLLLDNKDIFLSKRAINSFGGYANSQLQRLENKASRTVSQEREEQFILRSIENASIDFRRRYFDHPEDSIRLYIDSAVNEGLDTEIFMDVALTHYPLRDYKDMVSEMQSIIRSYRSIGRRNENAMTHDRISKHMMHLVRLYLMCIDILSEGKIVTYRDKDHDLLMHIRRGTIYIDENNQPTPDFYELVNGLEASLLFWKEHTQLPEHPDMDKVNKLHMQVNQMICDGMPTCAAGEPSFTAWRADGEET